VALIRPRSVVEKEKYTEKEAAHAIQQIAEGLHHCHVLGIAHRDLKPENLMYASPDKDAVVKIVDFGLGKVIGETNVMFTACGTPGYVAPEILRGESYTTKVDIWSLGVIMYILLCGFPPFYSDNNAVVSRPGTCPPAPAPHRAARRSLGHHRPGLGRGGPPGDLACRGAPSVPLQTCRRPRPSPPLPRPAPPPQLFDQIRRAEFDFPSPWWDGVSADAKDLICRMLVVDPAARYSAEDVMEHVWVKSQAAGAAGTDLSGAQASIRKLRLKERLRAGVKAIGAMAALRKMVGSSAAASTKAELILKGAAAASAAAKAAAGGGSEAEAAAAAEAAVEAVHGAGASASASAGPA